jgi:hypothetical protein
VFQVEFAEKAFLCCLVSTGVGAVAFLKQSSADALPRTIVRLLDFRTKKVVHQFSCRGTAAGLVAVQSGRYVVAASGRNAYVYDTELRTLQKYVLKMSCS